MLQLKLSEATAARRRLPLVLVDDTDGKTAETGVTFAAGDIKVSKNGGLEANHGGAVTEVAGGHYFYEATQAELDTVGYLYLRFTKAGVRTFHAVAQVVAFDPYSAAGLGLSNLDAIKAKTDQLTFTNLNKVDAAVLAAADFAQGAADKVWGTTTRTLTALGASLAQEIWDRATSALVTVGSVGKLLVDNLNAAVTTRAAPGDAMALVANAINDAQVGTDMDIYQARVVLFDDDVGLVDRYVVIFHKNGQPVTTGITVPTIQVINAATGADLIASTALTEIGALGLYRHQASAGARIADGGHYIAKVVATIDGSSRTMYEPVGRDS